MSKQSKQELIRNRINELKAKIVEAKEQDDVAALEKYRAELGEMFETFRVNSARDEIIDDVLRCVGIGTISYFIGLGVSKLIQTCLGDE